MPRNRLRINITIIDRYTRQTLSAATQRRARIRVSASTAADTIWVPCSSLHLWILTSSTFFSVTGNVVEAYAILASSLPSHLRANMMTSSTKPEVRNILHCRQRRTESRSELTCAESFVELGRVVFEISERTHRHTY